MTLTVGGRVDTLHFMELLPSTQRGVGEGRMGGCALEHLPSSQKTGVSLVLLTCTFNHVSCILKCPVGLAVSVNNRGENIHVHVHEAANFFCCQVKLLCLVLS